MSFAKSIKTVFTKYADFKGRARRSEYWWFTLAYAIVMGILSAFARGSVVMTIICVLAGLACLLPKLGVSVRRLHDIGRSGWWLLICLTCVGLIIVIIWECMDSQPGENKYGSNPKE